MCVCATTCNCSSCMYVCRYVCSTNKYTNIYYKLLQGPVRPYHMSTHTDIHNTYPHSDAPRKTDKKETHRVKNIAYRKRAKAPLPASHIDAFPPLLSLFSFSVYLYVCMTYAYIHASQVYPLSSSSSSSHLPLSLSNIHIENTSIPSFTKTQERETATKRQER